MRTSMAVVLALTLLCACTTQKLVLHPAAAISQLSICVDYGPSVPATMQLRFDQSLDDFMVRYNSRPHPFRLTTCQDAETSALRLYVAETRLVSAQQQTTGIIVSAVGLSLPFLMIGFNAPFYLDFYYFPRDVSQTSVSLSEDISAQSNYWLVQNFSSPGFLIRMDKQMNKHADKLEWYLSHTIDKLEKSYLRNKKKQARRLD